MNKIGEIFANHIPDKASILKMEKELIQLNSKIRIIQFKNGQRIWTGLFPKKTHKEPTGTSKGAQITNHQENVSQNHNEISPHTRQNGIIEQTRDKQSGQGCGEQRTLGHWCEILLTGQRAETVRSKVHALFLSPLLSIHIRVLGGSAQAPLLSSTVPSPWVLSPLPATTTCVPMAPRSVSPAQPLSEGLPTYPTAKWLRCHQPSQS